MVFNTPKGVLKYKNRHRFPESPRIGRLTVNLRRNGKHHQFFKRCKDGIIKSELAYKKPVDSVYINCCRFKFCYSHIFRRSRFCTEVVIN